MKSIISCIVLAAVVALVSADCGLQYYTGQKCNASLCIKYNETYRECESVLKKQFFDEFKNKAQGAEAFGQFTPEQKEAMFKKGCEDMIKCLNEKLDVNSLEVEGKNEYSNIQGFCKITTKETPVADAQGKEVYRYYEGCVLLQAMMCCEVNPNWGGGGHGGGQGKPGDKLAELMAPEHQLKSIFF